MQFIIDSYEERGEKRQAEIIRKRMDGSYRSQPKVSLNNIEIPDEFFLLLKQPSAASCLQILWKSARKYKSDNKPTEL